MAHEKVDFGIEVPGLLSFLAFNDPRARVKGLDSFVREDWPPVPVVHYAFELMVACGVFLAVVGIIFIFGLVRKKDYLSHKNFLRLLVFCTPLGFVAIEAGWTVTEVGRQPWILYGIMKTKDALTPMPGLIYPFMTITALYIFLTIIVAWLMVRQFRNVSNKSY
jgi:cytochrome d ubiquinol oxidase subunit I